MRLCPLITTCSDVQKDRRHDDGLAPLAPHADGELNRGIVERLNTTMNPDHSVEFQRAAKRVIDCARQNVRAAVAVWNRRTQYRMELLAAALATGDWSNPTVYARQRTPCATDPRTSTFLRPNSLSGSNTPWVFECSLPLGPGCAGERRGFRDQH